MLTPFELGRSLLLWTFTCPVGAVFNRASGFIETREVSPTGCALGKRAYRWNCRDSHVPVGAVFNRALGFIKTREVSPPVP